jgi:hypothetical protein
MTTMKRQAIDDCFLRVCGQPWQQSSSSSSFAADAAASDLVWEFNYCS